MENGTALKTALSEDILAGELMISSGGISRIALKSGEEIFIIPGWGLDFSLSDRRKGFWWEYRRNRVIEIMKTAWVLDTLENNSSFDRMLWFDQRTEYQQLAEKLLQQKFQLSYGQVFWDNKIRYGLMRRMATMLWPAGPRLNRYASRREYRRMEPLQRLRIARAYWLDVATFFDISVRGTEEY